MQDDNCIYPGVSQFPGRHWLKWAMNWFYQADYTHAWIGFRLGGVPLLYHSTGFGVHVMGFREFKNTRIIQHQWRIPLAPDIFRNFVDEAFAETGKRYGSRQLYGMAIAKLLHLKQLPFGANRDDQHVCSETAGRILMKYTPCTWEGKDPDLYTPKDFYDSCKRLEAMGVATGLNLSVPAATCISAPRTVE